ncbi:hypothetical protein [Magnetospira sp. QH-2]|uniref:hypothetical protein n=1 Tax=Magnetospira sp. (strain QH-2) TaxID=1288970 RepID=UPI0003E81111|nr:hypothetical protein [Magnetospira sp. QH-2]CCQ74437.1 hypothetical protein of unknown function [Magnetospira sp. QH-2]
MTQEKTATPAPDKATESRRDKQAEALRANLAKRKQQQRARKSPDKNEPISDPDS